MENSEALPQPEIKKIDGIGEYEIAVSKLLSLAQRQIRIFDKTVSPEFNSVARYEILRRFLFADRNNRLEIIVHDTSNLGMLCPRLVMLLKQFSYAIDIRETQDEAKHVHDAFVVADVNHYCRRFHVDNPRGVVAHNDLSGAQDLLKRLIEIREASFTAVSATTLGL